MHVKFCAVNLKDVDQKEITWVLYNVRLEVLIKFSILFRSTGKTQNGCGRQKGVLVLFTHRPQKVRFGVSQHTSVIHSFSVSGY